MDNEENPKNLEKNLENLKNVELKTNEGLESTLKELYEFYSSRKEFKNGWLHCYTVENFINVYEEYKEAVDNKKSNRELLNAKKKLLDFVKNNAYYLSSLIIISEIAKKPENIILFDKEERHDLEERFKKSFESVDPLCYVKLPDNKISEGGKEEKDKKVLLGLDYGVLYDNNGPVIRVIKEEDGELKIKLSYKRNFNLKALVSNKKL